MARLKSVVMTTAPVDFAIRSKWASTSSPGSVGQSQVRTSVWTSFCRRLRVSRPLLPLLRFRLSDESAHAPELVQHEVRDNKLTLYEPRAADVDHSSVNDRAGTSNLGADEPKGSSSLFRSCCFPLDERTTCRSRAGLSAMRSSFLLLATAMPM